MKITIETIPHGEQRIPGQVGDWVLDNGKVVIRVSKLGNWRYEAAVAVHELVEALLCMDKGISGAEVDAFDISHTQAGYEGEPGDAPVAPYRDQHCFATAVERMLIAAFGISWAEYDAAVEALP